MADSLTILLAAYNSERHVGALLDSVLGQSAAGFSLLARDDCSSDGTFDVLSEYAKKDPRITALRSNERSGSAQNNFFRLLLESPESDYIMFCDDDDIWLPDKIEKTLARMRELEARRGKNTPLLVHGDLEVVRDDLSVISPSLFKYEGLSPERKSLRELLVQNNVTGCTVMINRALRELIPSQPASSVMHDWWCALIAAAFGEISVIYEPLMRYRQHGSNEVGAYNALDLGASAKRLSDKERNARIYGAMFAQGGCFADTFADKLTKEQLLLCRDWAAMAQMTKAQKLATIVRRSFYKNTLLRNIGQLSAI